MKKKPLSPGPWCSRSLGITGGIFCAVDCAAMALLSMAGVSFLWFTPEVMPLYQSMIPGYSATVQGAVIGAVWGFVVAGIILFLFATVYNYFWQKFFCGK
jgi:hypothetical protein